jgi:hypothetical protein
MRTEHCGRIKVELLLCRTTPQQQQQQPRCASIGRHRKRVIRHRRVHRAYVVHPGPTGRWDYITCCILTLVRIDTLATRRRYTKRESC